jgi:REP element-mobilizing transposase RayT
MPEDPQPYRRKLLRLPDYDYSSEGGYFVTIVTHKRIPFFGTIIENSVLLTDRGQIARDEWFHTGQLRDNVELFKDEFVVMPNHIHGIIWLNDKLPVGVEQKIYICGEVQPVVVGVERRSTPTRINFPKVVPGSIPAIIRAYKSAVTYAINLLQHTPGQPVWQRNYYEHIIRDEKDYETMIEYIYMNPHNWEKDEEYH